MKTPIIYLLVISFLLQSCYTYKVADLKNIQFKVGEKYKITQNEKTETAKLMAVHDSLLSVSVDKKGKDILISNITKIERQEPTITAVILSAILIGVVWLTFELLDVNANSNDE